MKQFVRTIFILFFVFSSVLLLFSGCKKEKPLIFVNPEVSASISETTTGYSVFYNVDTDFNSSQTSIKGDFQLLSIKHDITIKYVYQEYSDIGFFNKWVDRKTTLSNAESSKKVELPIIDDNDILTNVIVEAIVTVTFIYNKDEFEAVSGNGSVQIFN